tara:strand:+ start:828 stop:1328 length:501 start_codon:yes stop_codon:yes gene_type:complete
MKFINSIKDKINLVSNKINDVKNKINDFKQKASNSIFVKIAYWFFMIFLWWPIKYTMILSKYTMILSYYLMIWPFLKILSIESESPNFSSPNTGKNINDTQTQKSTSALRGWEIQTYESNYWVRRTSGNDASANYISHRVQEIKNQNQGKRTRAIYTDTKQVIDIA